MIKKLITRRVNNITLLKKVKCMNRRFIIQTLGISLVILLAPFFINNALASYAASSIGFDINESISDANYLQFKIKAAEHYSVTVWLEDGDGETIKIRFSSQDDYDPGDYKLNEEEDRLTMYFSSSTITYESESFEDLISLFLSEDDDTTFDPTDNPKVTKAQVYGGMYFDFYSIALADNQNFDDPCWSKDAADWGNLNNYIADGGDRDITYLQVQFYNTYVHVTNTPSYSSPPYSPWSIGWNQLYNYGWNQPSYGWNQPSYGWNQPSYGWNQPSYGWNQPSYGWNQPSYGWNQPYYGWNQPSYGWNQPAYAGYQQPYNPYGYQQFFDDDDYDYYPPHTDWSRIIWQDPFSGYDPLTGSLIMI